MQRADEVALQHTLAHANNPLEKFKASVKKRLGQSGIKNLGRMFRIMDDDGSRCLSRDEFEKGVRERSLIDGDKHMNQLFEIFDQDGSGNINYDEFLLAIRDPMSEKRLALVKQAFQKLDRTGDGFITVEDLVQVYSVNHHPKYKSGEWSASECLREFLDAFDSKDQEDGKVTYDEFVNYYYGVSCNIDNDAYFDLMMRNAWKI